MSTLLRRKSCCRQYSTSSYYTFYSAKGDLASPTPVSHQTAVPERCFRRECPFVAWISHPRIGDPNGAHPSTEFGLPLHHTRFLEWVGAPESARLLDRGPAAWIRSLSRAQSVDAARKLHHDVVLMTSNLNILDQYVLCLQGTATKILELALNKADFPSAPLPRVCHVVVHMDVRDSPFLQN